MAADDGDAGSGEVGEEAHDVHLGGNRRGAGKGAEVAEEGAGGAGQQGEAGAEVPHGEGGDVGGVVEVEEAREVLVQAQHGVLAGGIDVLEGARVGEPRQRLEGLEALLSAPFCSWRADKDNVRLEQLRPVEGSRQRAAGVHQQDGLRRRALGIQCCQTPTRVE